MRYEISWLNFINEIVNCVTHSTIRLVADDTVVYCPLLIQMTIINYREIFLDFIGGQKKTI